MGAPSAEADSPAARLITEVRERAQRWGVQNSKLLSCERHGDTERGVSGIAGWDAVFAHHCGSGAAAGKDHEGGQLPDLFPLGSLF